MCGGGVGGGDWAVLFVAATLHALLAWWVTWGAEGSPSLLRRLLHATIHQHYVRRLWAYAGSQCHTIWTGAAVTLIG